PATPPAAVLGANQPPVAPQNALAPLPATGALALADPGGPVPLPPPATPPAAVPVANQPLAPPQNDHNLPPPEHGAASAAPPTANDRRPAPSDGGRGAAAEPPVPDRQAGGPSIPDPPVHGPADGGQARANPRALQVRPLPAGATDSQAIEA